GGASAAAKEAAQRTSNARSARRRTRPCGTISRLTPAAGRREPSSARRLERRAVASERGSQDGATHLHWLGEDDELQAEERKNVDKRGPLGEDAAPAEVAKPDPRGRVKAERTRKARDRRLHAEQVRARHHLRQSTVGV